MRAWKANPCRAVWPGGAQRGAAEDLQVLWGEFLL